MKDGQASNEGATSRRLRGSCVCGAVTFEVSGPFTRFYTCHARSGDFEIVPAGSLDDPPPIAPDSTIFWDERAPWFEASCETPRYAGYAV